MAASSSAPISRFRGYPSLGIARNRRRPDARAERRRGVHPHRLHAEDRAALEPFPGDLDALLALRFVRAGKIGRRVVRDVLALDAGRRHASRRASPATSLPTRSTDRTWRPANMLSSVTSPNSPEKRSMCVTPGNVSFVNCGKSSIVISPYFSFICALVIPRCPGRRRPPPVAGGALGDGSAAAVAGLAAAGLPGPPARPPPGRVLKM